MQAESSESQSNLPQLGMIWAQDQNRVIGKQGFIPWFVPEDLKFFKTTTLGCAVIMGRKTWESLPDNFRPLPRRQNIVVTNDPTYSAWGAETVLSPEAAIAAIEPGKFAWVIGGESLYKHFLNVASKLLVTEVDTEVIQGDTYAPEISALNFHKVNGTGFIPSANSTSPQYKHTVYLNRSIHATPLSEVVAELAKASEQDENKFSERPSP